MRTELSSKGKGAIAVSLAILIFVPIASGCLGGEEEPRDLSEWWVAMTITRFDSNGQVAVNVTELLFNVRFGNITEDTWMLQGSRGFYKGDSDFFPIRIEARYDDGASVEDFPILGSSNVVTGAIRFDGDRMKVQVDGDKDLIVKDDSIDNYPHGYEKTVKLTGDLGELTLYFNLNEPQ
ncbi:MAG: hypothetical protein GWN18_07520 [Thermoplasmata archaeon]|nr:hypothetical protein [Thermoplasmata archaeon]NIS11912.1 hypothetical protein [Thermoplasmata archaeon]NIS19814.1 hypothetical protein [Thermoplasmata archaeon]NIT77009.1 hypothetical protein [Thermoplasmata archaeon]NIU48923.1 hypothetical protein [Thermoplasmata archaeon]